ncbi:MULTISPECIES: hypothetical protein [Streptococcus dysgalactiae group]|uniref:Uncharacterized protein n=1 Tax=Streptococcus dysgalactiae subsp. equisimilis AC-2713 TaxID=759913 RepID=A0AB33R3B8_STREQ|nr:MULTISPECIES: hypothetical protein [Streptococcus dysgalactiae group]HEP5160295.1 hypothetical protein [Streptococcus pyogenes]QJD61271.1 hypothetical protein HG697_01840 [Streptococcus dysgalactiae subsp. equisimilis]QJD63122.1 hypothetical protein HHM65_01540 [Streptococcus dysgalactiae subsp. equisimilis]QJR38586.1 hypothetical protein HHM66_01540 [Streptococcus dysgalactiae subsp. equisimilis]QUQ80767.1 hypothetical protein LJFMMFNO_01822 [Streptococcus equi subsp. zooepidemicus]
MTQFYDYTQIIELVSGLNSVSTLKKWRLKIEQLTGHTFQEDRIRTGKRSYSKVFLFTADDIEKLQQIADTKGNLGLDKAILKVYAPSRASPLSINQKINRLTFQLTGLSQRVTDLTQQEQLLAIRIEQLGKQIEDLEKPKKRKLFGK